jgi:thiosulfate/3-mercaptopyruvate sulfurtransferase
MTSLFASDIAKTEPGPLRIVDATWVLPGRTEPLDQYLRGTTGAIDTDGIKALPPAARPIDSHHIFGRAGLSGSSPVAVYDRAGLFSAPWVWWLLRSNGVDAQLIEGWGDTKTDFNQDAAETFVASKDAMAMNATQADVLNALDTDTQIIDARPAARFNGDAPEPREGCRAGHIPGSLNIPFPTLKSSMRNHFHDQATLTDIFKAQSVDLSRPIITTCGSGVTASGLAFALTRCGAQQVQVYQGSWAEWGMDPDLPIEMGA